MSHDEKFLKKLIGGIEGEEEETPEQKAQREAEAAKWKAEQEKRQRDYEESVRLAVPRDIAQLRKDAAEKLALADQLEQLLVKYPNLRKHTGRWNKVAYYTKDVNALVDRFDMRHNCGCCNDSPLEVWPYLETPLGKVYSEPSMFRVGEKEPFYHGDRPYKGWDKTMQDAGIPESIIGAVKMHFRREAEEAKELADRLYDEEKDPEDDEPAV
jgi:ribosomal 50S subunit-associated protein YjgA (DUF615 family)